MKWLGVLLLSLPGWDASPSQGSRQYSNEERKKKETVQKGAGRKLRESSSRAFAVTFALSFLCLTTAGAWNSLAIPLFFVGEARAIRLSYYINSRLREKQKYLAPDRRLPPTSPIRKCSIPGCMGSCPYQEAPCSVALFNNRHTLQYLSHFVIKSSHFVIPLTLYNNTCHTL